MADAVITSVAVDCTNARLTVTGTDFLTPPLFVVTLDGSVVSYSLVSNTATDAVLYFILINDGTWCVGVCITTLQTSDAVDILTSDGATIFAAPATSVCNSFICSIRYVDSVVDQWQLWRCDIKARPEDNA